MIAGGVGLLILSREQWIAGHYGVSGVLILCGVLLIHRWEI